MTEGNIIETVGLKKQYQDVTALDGLDLTVPSGSIYGLLGRNGAGKTTAIKTLMGLVRPTAGTARVFGLAADQSAASIVIRQRTGFVSEERDLRNFDLPPARAVKALSRGARTKLALLLALCRGAELLILDEATSGLDPMAAEEVLQALIGHVANEGTTVFFSSHQIAEIEQIADHVVIIDRGRAVLEGALDDLREAYRRIELVFEGDAPPAQFHSPGVMRIERRGRTLSVFARSGAERIIEEARSLGPVSAEAHHITLKEVFLELISRER